MKRKSRCFRLVKCGCIGDLEFPHDNSIETAIDMGSGNRNEVLEAPRIGESATSNLAGVISATSSEDGRHVSTVNKAVFDLDSENGIEVPQSLALLELVMGNAKSRILKIENALKIKEEASPEIGNGDGLKEFLRGFQISRNRKGAQLIDRVDFRKNVIRI